MKNKIDIDVWFDYIVSNKPLWPKSFTPKKLSLIRDAVLNDVNMRYDLLVRHCGMNSTPEEMLAEDKETYDHAIGNLVSSISYKILTGPNRAHRTAASKTKRK